MPSELPPPPLRALKPRLTPEMQRLGINESLLLDKVTANAFRTWARYQGWGTVQRTEPEGVRVWRIEAQK